MSDNRVRPFSNGTEFMIWNEVNCCNCKKYHTDDSGMVIEPICEIDQAFVEAMFGDGTISRDIAIEMGLIGEDGKKRMLFFKCASFTDQSEPDPIIDSPGQLHLFDLGTGV